MQVIDIPALYANAQKRVSEQEEIIAQLESNCDKITDLKRKRHAITQINGRKEALQHTKAFVAGITPVAEEILNPPPVVRQAAANRREADLMLQEAANIRANIISVTTQAKAVGDSVITQVLPDNKTKTVTVSDFKADQEKQAQAREAAAEALLEQIPVVEIEEVVQPTPLPPEPEKKKSLMDRLFGSLS